MVECMSRWVCEYMTIYVGMLDMHMYVVVSLPLYVHQDIPWHVHLPPTEAYLLQIRLSLVAKWEWTHLVTQLENEHCVDVKDDKISKSYSQKEHLLLGNTYTYVPMEKFQLYHYSGVASTYVYTQKWSLQYSPLCVEGNESSKLKPLESALNIVHTTEFSAVFPQAQSQKMACLCRGGGSSAPFTILLRGPPMPIHDYWGVLL